MAQLFTICLMRLAKYLTWIRILSTCGKCLCTCIDVVEFQVAKKQYFEITRINVKQAVKKTSKVIVSPIYFRTQSVDTGEMERIDDDSEMSKIWHKITDKLELWCYGKS